FLYMLAKTNFMNKNATLYTFMIAAIVTASSCNNAATTSSSQTTTDSSVVGKIDTAAQNVKQGAENIATDAKNMVSGNVDSDFVVKAATTNNAELKILQAGMGKA